ncbi:MAG: RuBisCO accumulation factor 1 [Cyanobacteria bacterium P01_A01_bin.114]
MTTAPFPEASENIDKDALLLKLRRKQGSWPEWGNACQALQKAGLSPQKIFEETGFEPIHQNQIIVGAQVYQSVLAGGVSDAVRSHFEQRGSDSLYELRILSQTDRAKAVEFIHQYGLDSDQVKDIVKPLKEYSYRSQLPAGFSDHPGDAIAYHYWSLARQQADLQARSRLIAKGLRFVQSEGGRQQIENLLTDFAVVKTKPAPRLPLFRIEDESDLPCLVPVVGEAPLTTEAFKAVPVLLPEEPFGIVKFAGEGAWAPVPGWQVILRSEDPVALLVKFDALPNAPQDAPSEQTLVIVDRAQRSWNDASYFACDAEGQLTLRWFDEDPDQPLLGRVIVIMRPKRILDEDYSRELWQLDE